MLTLTPSDLERTERPEEEEEDAAKVFVEQMKAADLKCLKPRILVAEDDTEMRRLLVESLRTDGYEVVEIENGEQLARSIDFHRSMILRGRFFDVDLIISDIRMPGMSGLKVLRELRKHDQLTPVILITAFGDDITHSEGYRLDAAAVIDKPLDLDALREYVRELLPPDVGVSGGPALW